MNIVVSGPDYYGTRRISIDCGTVGLVATQFYNMSTVATLTSVTILATTVADDEIQRKGFAGWRRYLLTGGVLALVATTSYKVYQNLRI